MLVLAAGVGGVDEVVGRAKAWWNQPDQFDWVQNALRQRGMLTAARRVMAMIAASSALVPLTLLLYPRRLGLGAFLFGAFAAGFSVWITGYWLTHWPTRRRSEVFVTLGALTIAGWSGCQPIPAMGLLGCTAMAITGGYLAFFHTAKLVTANSVLATITGIAAAYRLADQTGSAIAGAAFWLTWLLNLTVPVSIRAIAGAMRAFAERADVDPLTGLLNRRGFIQRVDADVAAMNAGTNLTLFMMDLDDFKTLNDTHGHTAGDRALVAVADLLRERLASAVICRAGGEEFLVALTSPRSLDAGKVADQVCRAIAALPDGVTVSIGTSSARLTRDDVLASRELLTSLIEAADTAMYRAKRFGGNQTHHI